MEKRPEENLKPDFQRRSDGITSRKNPSECLIFSTTESNPTGLIITIAFGVVTWYTINFKLTGGKTCF